MASVVKWNRIYEAVKQNTLDITRALSVEEKERGFKVLVDKAKYIFGEDYLKGLRYGILEVEKNFKDVDMTEMRKYVEMLEGKE